MDHLEAGEAGAGPKARAGDEDVERPVFCQDVADRPHAGACGHVGAGTDVVGDAAHLLDESLSSVEHEDLWIAHHGT